MAELSRRKFAALAAAAAAAPFARAREASGATVAAGEVIDRIRKHVGVEWKADTVDTVKAGDPAATVGGIVTTSMATMAVLQQAVKARANFVITAQPTFYGRADLPTPPAGRGSAPPAAAAADPVFAAKHAFITTNNLVVFRLSEHWRQRQPDPFVQGLAAALGWTKYSSATNPQQFDVPAVGLDALAGHVKKALQLRGGIRVLGDPGISVRRVGLLPGTTSIQAALKLLPDVDVIVAGEVREWETVEYARDKVFAGERKGLILVGRVVSDEPGMNLCASWLKTFVPEVPVRHVSAGDPYWRPSR